MLRLPAASTRPTASPPAHNGGHASAKRHRQPTNAKCLPCWCDHVLPHALPLSLPAAQRVVSPCSSSWPGRARCQPVSRGLRWRSASFDHGGCSNCRAQRGLGKKWPGIGRARVSFQHEDACSRTGGSGLARQCDRAGSIALVANGRLRRPSCELTHRELK